MRKYRDFHFVGVGYYKRNDIIGYTVWGRTINIILRGGHTQAKTYSREDSDIKRFADAQQYLKELFK
jgi:hypothetical protein